MFSAFHLHFFVPVSGQLTSAVPSALGGASPEETPLSCSQSAVKTLLPAATSFAVAGENQTWLRSCGSPRSPLLEAHVGALLEGQDQTQPRAPGRGISSLAEKRPV